MCAVYIVITLEFLITNLLYRSYSINVSETANHTNYEAMLLVLGDLFIYIKQKQIENMFSIWAQDRSQGRVHALCSPQGPEEVCYFHLVLIFFGVDV